MSRRLALLAALGVAAWLGVTASAGATTLPSTITSDQTWTAAGSPYTGNSVTINSGVTVTVEPGAVIQLNGAFSRLTVNGTLDVNGTASDPAAFTSSSDSAAGEWYGISLATSSSSLDHATVRYAKNGIGLSGAVSPSITNSTIHDNAWVGINVPDGSPAITGNEVRDNGMQGISVTRGDAEIADNTVSDNASEGIKYNVTSSAFSGEVNIHDNTVDGNGGQSGIYVNTNYASITGTSLAGNTVTDSAGKAILYYGGSIPADVDDNPEPTGNGSDATWISGVISSSTTWEDRGYPIVLQSTTQIPSGATLTLSPGLVLKGGFPGTYYPGRFSVLGTIDAQGTAEDPITMTSVYDDSIYGDTDGGGSSPQAAPRDWGGVIVDANSSGSVFDHIVLRYGGGGYQAALQTNANTTAVTNSTIDHNEYDGLKVAGGSPTITANAISSNGMAGISVGGPGVSTSPEIASNTLTGNTGTYGGGGGIDFRIESNQTGTVNIHDNEVEGNGGAAGIRVWQSQYATQVMGASIADNEIQDNAGRALMYNVSNGTGSIPADIDTMPAPTGNGSNAVWLSGRVTNSTTWEDRGFPFVFMNGWGLRIEEGVTLALAPGTVLKGEGSTAKISVWGTLDAIGEAGNPITVTSVKDDSVGGDTNGDGASTAPAPGDWAGIVVDRQTVAPGKVTLDRAELLYGGAGVSGMVGFYCRCTHSSVVRHAKLKKATTGIYVSGFNTGVYPTIQWNVFRGHTNYALQKNGSGAIDAQLNDWGSDNGPRPWGSGELVSLNVNVAPWWNSLLGPCFGPDAPPYCPIEVDPVNLATGGLVYDHADLRLTSKGVEPLLLRRSYNSDDTSDAGFGPGWSHTGLLFASEQESNDVIVRRADGRRDLFTENTGDYSPPPGVHDELVKEGDGTFKLTTPEGVVYDFDATGRIASITDDHGLTTTYGYNSSGRLQTITDPSSQTLTFTYNASNHITKVADSSGREVTYTYTAAGDLDTVTDPLGGVTDYDYDSAHRLTSITDPRQVTFLTNTYDSQGRIIEQTDGEGNVWTLDYAAGETTVTEPEGGTKTYEFDGSNRLTAETDQLDSITTYGYDGAGNVDSVTRPGGAQWSFDYDSAGNLASATDPLSGVRSMSYDSANHLTSYTDPRNETWTYTWSDDDLTKVTDPAAGETDLTYDSAGQPLTVTDPNDHTTEYAYDSRGNLTSETDPLDHTTTYAYNTRSHLTSKTEPGKAAETYTRNALGDLLSVTTPEGNTTSYDYDENGAPIEITDSALKVWTIERDGMERPTAYVDPLSNRTEIVYDGNLHPVSVTDRRNQTTTYTYDLANRLTAIELPEGGTWAFGYDARGNRTSVTDPRTNATTYTYDLADRMTAAAEPLSTTTAYGYDAAGNLTQVTDPRSNQTTFTYDELGRMTEIGQPLDKDTAFTYDPAGNLTSRITAEDAQIYAYDDANRPTEISDGTNALRSFGYDAADRLTEATDAQAKTMAIGYDDDDRVVSLDDNRGQTVALGYDSRGNLTQQVDGRGAVQYAYDELGRMAQLTDPQSGVSGFAYDPEGNLTSAELPNGVVTTNAYDGDGRLTNTSSEKAQTILQSFAYAYDAAGNRTSQTDRNNDTTTYAYDALTRLAEFDPPTGPAVTYAYDAAGNRTSAGGVTSSFNALNQLTGSSDGTSYDYDDAGRLIERTNGTQTTTYAWDPLDQLTGVDDGSNPISYTYDALGRRSERTEGSATETAHYGDLSDRPILDTDAAPSITKSYVQGPEGMLVEERAGSATSYPLADAHGDVATVTDDTGAVASRQEYAPWGSQLTGPSLENGYLGAYQRRSDPTTDLMQMGVRPYDPALGQFLDEDPVLGVRGMGQSVNRYLYALDNPLTRYDLDGRSVFGDLADVASSGVEWWTDGPDLSDFGAIDEMPPAAGEWWKERLEPVGGAVGDAGSAVGGAAGDAGSAAAGYVGDRLNYWADKAERFWNWCGNVCEFISGNAISCGEGGTAGALAGPGLKLVWTVPAPPAKVGAVAGCVLVVGVNHLAGL